MAALSLDALPDFADEQEKNPVVERKANQFGSTIITNISDRETNAARSKAATATGVYEQQAQRGKKSLICLLPVFYLTGRQVIKKLMRPSHVA